jgi:uridine kinase
MPTPRDTCIEQLANQLISQHLSHPLRVAVDGRTASGKTTIADEVADHLRSRGVTVIRTSISNSHYEEMSVLSVENLG